MLSARLVEGWTFRSGVSKLMAIGSLAGKLSSSASSRSASRRALWAVSGSIRFVGCKAISILSLPWPGSRNPVRCGCSEALATSYLLIESTSPCTSTSTRIPSSQEAKTWCGLWCLLPLPNSNHRLIVPMRTLSIMSLTLRPNALATAAISGSALSAGSAILNIGFPQSSRPSFAPCSAAICPVGTVSSGAPARHIETRRSQPV